MSTNYYFINKRDKIIANNLRTILRDSATKLGVTLNTFSKENEIDIEYCIESLVSHIRNIDLFVIEENRLFTTMNSKIIFREFNNFKQIYDFYNSHIGEYLILDEYGKEFTIEELEKIVIEYGGK